MAVSANAVRKISGVAAGWFYGELCGRGNNRRARCRYVLYIVAELFGDGNAGGRADHQVVNDKKSGK
jgi:hypothetical protein